MAQADAVLATVTRERARVLAPALLGSLIFFVVAARRIGIDVPAYVYAIEVLILGGLGVLTLALWRRRVPLKHAHLTAAAVLWSTTLATVVPMYATYDDLLLPFVITQAASAGVLLHRRYMYGTVIGINVAALPIVLFGQSAYSSVFISALLCASSFAPLIHGVVRNALLDIENHRLAYESLVETSPDAMFVYSRKTLEIKWVNASMLELLGYTSADQLLGHRSVETFVYPEDRDRLQAHRFAVQEGLERSGIDVRWQGVDGGIRYVHATSRPVSFDGDSVLVVARDMTEKHLADERSQMLEEQVRHAQRMESIGQLAGGVAHDFNNILAVIMSNAGLLVDELASKRMDAEEATEIIAAAERGAALTRQLLAFSRKQHRQVTTFVLDDVLADLNAMLRRIVGEDVEVKMDLSSELTGIRADRSQVEQVVMNLVGNARDAMPNGGALTIETRKASLDAHSAAKLGVVPGDYVRLSVDDTGVGMSDDVKARIFEPFFTTKEVGKGTGLGLATVFGIVKQSEGAISVRSASRRGTRFDIYLPRAEGTPARVSTSRVSMTDLIPLGSETVLLVEDDAQVRKAVARQLRSCGYAVLEASDARAAMAIVEANEPFDVLLTDLVMPGIDGRRLATLVTTARRKIEVVFMSGYTEHVALKDSAIVPRESLLAKPFTQKQLSSAIRWALKKRDLAA